MSAISLTYNDTEIISDVIIASAEFESEANGVAGLCRFRVKDDGHTYARGYFKAGGLLHLRIDGVLVWGGWVMSVGVGYAFDVDDTRDPERTPRFYTIEGVDWNVLFTRRYIHDDSDPVAAVKTYPGDTQDGDVVRDIITTYTDFLGDGISLDGIRNVGPISAFGGEAFRPGSMGDQVGAMMNRIMQSNGALYYIDPNKVFQYRDTEQPTAPFALSDQPIVDGNAVGYREMRISLPAQEMANDVLIWGAGMGSDNMVFARVTDIESVDLFGTFQHADIMTDVYRENTARARAQSYVYGSASSHRGHRQPLVDVQLAMFQPGLNVGMVVDFVSHVFDDDGLDGIIIDNPGPVPANLANFMARIRHIESNDNYSAQNRSSGAYGAYQIMPGNWAQWATEALGLPRSSGFSKKDADPSTWTPTPTQANQDAVATFRFTRAYTWLADWRRIAAMWRSGGSVAVRQPSDWSRGTILYVNHACVPLGYPTTTNATILPNLP